ncbi:MAG: hypothetical protein Q4A54_08430 [Parabacteroides sp.]|nr:hypothetical protein [Parabacteroides sp.]
MIKITIFLSIWEDDISDREKQVLGFINKGLTRKEIAETTLRICKREGYEVSALYY